MKYAIDFDDVVYQNGEIDKTVCDKIKNLREIGNEVVLYTSRSGEALKRAKEIIEGKVEFDDVVGGKLFADAYVDDKNMLVDEFLEWNGEERMAIKNNREYRSMIIQKREADPEAEPNFKVTGYASTFDEYELFNFDGVSYRERIEHSAFDNADMSDVIFLYNHEGMVYARQKNGTLNITVDEHGLYTETDLSSTTESRKLFEAIDAGLVDQMSFAFTVDDDVYENGEDYCVRIVKRIGKLYDVSAVSIPANPNTGLGISARSLFDGEIEKRKAERLMREKIEALAEAKRKFEEA